MAKATFENFVKERFISPELSDNQDARKIFEIINADANIEKAIELTRAGKPALLASVEEIENYFESRGENSTFRLDEPRNCQLVGRMQRTVLAAFGYESKVNAPMESSYFHSAMTYRRA